MLLRFGVIAMVCSVALAVGVAVLIILDDRSASQPVSAKSTEAIAATSTPQPEPQSVSSVDRAKQYARPEPRAKPKEQPEPRVQSQPEPRVQSQPEPRVQSQPEPQPQPKPGSTSESEPSPEPQPVSENGWPAPGTDEIAATHKHRSYSLVPGAIMGLTIDAIGLHNVPVMNSDSPNALNQGVVHIPETSLPWSHTPQRNVYIAGHRLGYPGTGSRLIFYELDELTTGDEIVLRDRQGRAYHYRVSEIFRADPNDSWVMGQVRGRDMVTLQTCTGPGYQQRLIVRADRIEAAAAV